MSPSAPPDAPGADDPERSGGLPETPVILVTGKGGVGKSTVAASIAFAWAQAGRRVLLAEVGAYPAMGAFFGGATMVQAGAPPRPVGERLHGILLDHDSCLRAYLEQHLERARLIRTVLSHPVALTFLRAAPSVTEVTTLNRIVQLADDSRFDHVVVDLPAYGHAFQMMKAPQTIASMVRGGVITGPSERIVGFLRTPDRAALVAVTLPEEMPVSETIEHAAKIKRDIGVATSLVVLNQAVPPLETGQSPDELARLREAAQGGEDADATRELLALGMLRARGAEQTQACADELLQRIAAPIVRVPVLTRTADARALLEHTAAALAAGSHADDGRAE